MTNNCCCCSDAGEEHSDLCEQCQDDFDYWDAWMTTFESTWARAVAHGCPQHIADWALA